MHTNTHIYFVMYMNYREAMAGSQYLVSITIIRGQHCAILG